MAVIAVEELVRSGMPDGLRAVSGYTPTGAAGQAISDIWAGGVPATSSFLVMGADALGAGSLVAWLFRWD